MKRVIYRTEEPEKDLDDILCMANMLGKNVKVPKPLPFSFFFSGKGSIPHDIRVKPVMNPNKMKESEAGNLQLHGEWIYTSNAKDGKIKQSDIREMKAFFRKYFILFSAVWDGLLYESSVQEYLSGQESFADLLKDFDFYEDYQEDMDDLETIEELEAFCRENNLVNFHGN